MSFVCRERAFSTSVSPVPWPARLAAVLGYALAVALMAAAPLHAQESMLGGYPEWKFSPVVPQYAARSVVHYGLADESSAEGGTAPAPGSGEESPLDRAVRELGQPPASPLDRAVGEAGQPQESALDRAVRELESAPSTGAAPAGAPSAVLAPAPTPAAAPTGGGQLRLADVSLDGLVAAGSSTERDIVLDQLEGGGHDPRKRGFTVQNVELSMIGACDPYFDAEMHLNTFLTPLEGMTVVELEEAFMTSRSLPLGLQLKMGHFLTEFGRINPTHPHAWTWQDAPIISTRLFGPDGMRAPGARLSCLVPVDWFSEVFVGIQNANGETMASFLANEEFFSERPIGGRPFWDRPVRSCLDMVYTYRWENSWTICDDQITWLLGASVLQGPNATGPKGNTQIFGLDMTRKWKPSENRRGWPFTIWTGEIMMRRYRADRFFDPRDALDPADDIRIGASTLEDWGFYAQYLWGFKERWAAGLRYEYVWSRGDSLDEDFAQLSRNDDPFRDERHRLSPLLAFYPSEFCRFRFQYNYDHAQHLPGKDAHSVWLGAEFVLGSHPAHKF